MSCKSVGRVLKFHQNRSPNYCVRVNNITNMYRLFNNGNNVQKRKVRSQFLMFLLYQCVEY